MRKTIDHRPQTIDHGPSAIVHRLLSIVYRPSSIVRDEGFTLLEILVALAILGIALTLVLELFAGGLRLLGRSEESLRAAQLAAQKMEEVLMRQEAVTGERVEQGVFPDGTRWQVRVAPVPSPDATNLSAAVPWDLHEYAVRVTWSSGLRERSYDLYTTRLLQKGQMLK